MAGARVGLMYPVAWARLDRMQLSAERWQQLYDDLRVMERAGLEELGRQAKEKADEQAANK